MDLIFKIAGIILIIVGFLIVKHFPDISTYQPEKMTWAGVFVGLIVLFTGLALLFL